MACSGRNGIGTGRIDMEEKRSGERQLPDVIVNYKNYYWTINNAGLKSLCQYLRDRYKDYEVRIDISVHTKPRKTS